MHLRGTSAWHCVGQSDAARWQPCAAPPSLALSRSLSLSIAPLVGSLGHPRPHAEPGAPSSLPCRVVPAAPSSNAGLLASPSGRRRGCALGKEGKKRRRARARRRCGASSSSSTRTSRCLRHVARRLVVLVQGCIVYGCERRKDGRADAARRRGVVAAFGRSDARARVTDARARAPAAPDTHPLLQKVRTARTRGPWTTSERARPTV